MITERDWLLPIVTFDEADGWDTVRQLCADYLDLPGQERLEDALKVNVKCVAIEKHYID